MLVVSPTGELTILLTVLALKCIPSHLLPPGRQATPYSHSSCIYTWPRTNQSSTLSPTAGLLVSTALN